MDRKTRATRKGAVGRARYLRRTMTVAEEILWNQVRRDAMGFHMRRQQPCGDYILDIYCAEARIAFEVDGPLHETAKDEARDRYMEERGILTVRFKEEDVRLDLGSVLRTIVDCCERRTGRPGNPNFSSWPVEKNLKRTPSPAPSNVDSGVRAE